MNRPIITCDIDSTLANTEHRASMIDPDDRDSTDWLAYAKACGEDTPTDVVVLLRALQPSYRIVLVTSRPAQAFQETSAWLRQHDVPYDHLLMCTDHDLAVYGDVTTWKVAAIENLDFLYDVALHLDDQWQVAQAIRTRLEIPTVIVRVYAPDHAMTL